MLAGAASFDGSSGTTARSPAVPGNPEQVVEVPLHNPAQLMLAGEGGEQAPAAYVEALKTFLRESGYAD